MTVFMFAADLLGLPWTRVRLTADVVLPVWVLFGLFTLLQIALWRLEKRNVDLTDAEVARWGGQLEVATPQILALVEERRTALEIAARVERDHQIPVHVTERYIVALARFRRGNPPPA
jgi:hypothetical protein